MMPASERLQAIRAFLQTAEAGSFSEAARQMGQSKSTIAKAVSRLEERLRVRLFQRTTRSLSLTDEGRIFRDSCTRALGELEQAEARLAAQVNQPTGRLRIALPVLFGRDRVMPLLLELMARHDGLELEALFSNRAMDLVHENIDMAVRIGELPDTMGLTMRKCGTQRMVTCAAPGYVERHGRPEAVDDLARHACIGVLRRDYIHPWQFTVGARAVSLSIRSRFRLGHVEAVLAAASAGAGIAQLPRWLAEPFLRDGRLEELLAPFEPPGLPINLLWPSSRIITPRLRATIDILAAGQLDG